MASRGMYAELEKFHNNIIVQAQEFELYGTLLDAMNAKQRYLGYRYGKDIQRKLNIEIEYYENVRNISLKARQLFNDMIASISFSVSSIEYETELANTISILQKYYEQTQSATIQYYFLLLQTEQNQNRNDFQSAQKILFQVKVFLESNVAIYTKIRIGAALINISNNYLFMFNFDKSIFYAHEALNFFVENEVNAAVTKEIEFYSLFYSNKIDKSEILIEDSFHASRKLKTPFVYSKSAYLFACIKTFRKEIDQSNELLKEVHEIEKDKEGWGIGVRILSVMNAIEIENFEKADREIEKLKRHIAKTVVDKIIRRRNLIIHDIFIQLMNMSYDFKKVYKSKQRLFNLLESNHADCRWKIKSPELLLFHEWFRSKMEERPYNHIAAIQKEKEKYLETLLPAS